MGEIEQATKKLTTRLSEAAGGSGAAVGALRQLNLTAAELQALPLDQRIVAIQDALNGFVPEAERAAVASDLFGDRAALAFLRIDSATLRDAARDVQDFGVAVSAADAAQVERTGDAIARLSLIWTGLVNRLTVAVAPALEAVATKLADMARATGPIGQAITAVFDNLGRLATYAATFAAVMAGRWVAGMAAAALSVRGLATALVFLRGALIRTGIGALIVGAGELVYLLQHSAGSGKSNTIAWTAYQLALLHDDNDRPVFDSVIVVVDRKVLDQQLQGTIRSFVTTPGYFRPIDETSAQLRTAIQSGARIIATTIHKFSTDHVNVLKNEAGKRFAIIIDEAHSSQSGKHADNLGRVLAESVLADEDLDDNERALLELQRMRGPQANLSYLAFTATPKNVTLERFGVRGPDGLPHPFHLYSMRQAIEEGFILDVLRNYQTYKTYFALERAIEEDPQLSPRKSNRKVARYVDFHETAMEQKAEVIVEHFRRHALPELNSQAKAMVVTASREHAVRTHRAITRYIRHEGYDDLKALVAFSGEIVVDGANLTEPGINGFGETELPGRFDSDDYNVLVVAEKYQTGFDQPKLVAMYVDRHLSGIQAVQTLSRLNRTFPGKERTYVLDFRNAVEDIKEAFRPYFNTTAMEEVSDPHQVYALLARMQEMHILDQGEIDRFVSRFLQANQRADERPVLEGIVRETVERFRTVLTEEQQEEFRQLLASFLRFYAFISQVIALEDSDLEKMYLFGSWLKRLLPSREAPQGGDVTDDMLELQAFRLSEGDEVDASLVATETKPLSPIDRFGANPFSDEERRTLSEIIKAFNDRHATNFTEEDYIRFEAVNEAILDDEAWAEMLRNNPPEVVRPRFGEEFMRRAILAFQRDRQMQSAFLQDREGREMIMGLMFGRAVRGARRIAS